MRLGRFACFVVLALHMTVASAIGQTFVFGAQGEPVQLDPAVITDGISGRITRQIYDGLVKYKGATTEVEASLAQAWEVSPDGKVWTFTLRRNVKFHDGTPFDAKAVVWNFERWWKTTHPQHDNQVKAGQTFEYWEGQFGGFDDKSIVTKVEATGSHTMRVTLKDPQAPFLANLAMFTFDIASPTAVEKWGTEFGKHPVGTGAYKLVEWKPNQEVVLEANPDYWGVKPKVKRVVVRNIKDNSQRLGALKAGEIHGMEGLNPDDVAVVKRDPNLQVLLRPTNTTGYIAFNYKVKEFQDKRVRQAFAYAINRGAIVDALYGGTGMAATQFQPPPLWGYNKDLKGYEYSPAKAQELLKEAGLGRRPVDDHLGRRQEGAAGVLVHVALAAVLPEPQGDRRGHGRRPRQGRHQGAAADRRVGRVPGQAQERPDAALHAGLDGRQRRPRQLPLLLLLLAGRVARGLLRQSAAGRRAAAGPEAHESVGPREALPAGRADAARRRRAAVHRQQPAAAGLRQEGEGLRHAPDGLGVLQHGRAAVARR